MTLIVYTHSSILVKQDTKWRRQFSKTFETTYFTLGPASTWNSHTPVNLEMRESRENTNMLNKPLYNGHPGEKGSVAIADVRQVAIVERLK